MNYLVLFTDDANNAVIKLRKPLSQTMLKSYIGQHHGKTPYLVYWGMCGVDVKEIAYHVAAVRTVKEIPNGDLKASILHAIEPCGQHGPN